MMNLKAVRDGFEQIKTAVGKEKQIVLQEIKDHNESCWMALYYLLNPMKTYGIGAKSLSKTINKTSTAEFYSLQNVLEYCSRLSGVSDGVVKGVQEFIEQNKEYEDLITGMVTKSITLGVTAKTVNKVAGFDYIPTFSVMLAEKFFEHPAVPLGEEFTITEKFDGIRCIVLLNEGTVKMFSRQGQPITGLVEIEKEFLDIYGVFDRDLAFDGELLISDRDGIPSKEQYKQTMKIVRKDEMNKTGITFHAFDVLEYDGFVEQTCHIQYYQRRQRLNTYIGNKHPHIEVVPALYIGKDYGMIPAMLNDQRALEHEGIMINLNHEVYQFKRTTALLKVKLMQDCDLLVTGVEEGSGKYAGTLGALVVDYKGNKLKVGSGFQDAVRDEFWKNQTDIIGKIVTVQYFEETEDANGVKSLRFPVFKDIRTDKTEPSYS